MFRLLTMFTLVIGFVAAARADLPVPPPPPEKKYVEVHNQVRLGKEFDDYVFFIAHGQGPGPPRYEYTRTTLSTKSTTSMPSGGRYQYNWLLAVPKASADRVPSARLTDPPVPVQYAEPRPMGVEVSATDVWELPGLKRLSFGDTATVDIKHRVGSITRTYTITGFDKGGVMETTVERDPPDPEAVKKPKSPAEAEPDETRTEAEPEPSHARSIVAGVALALSFAAGGFLLVRKQRARVVQTRD